MNTIRDQFQKLCEEVSACQSCARMSDSLRVLSPSAGPLEADIMFIGEAPGRHGADSSGIPFHGDKAGHNFESLLAQAKIDRSAAFVTNAALCNPKDENGNNATPSRTEIRNCSGFLARQIRIVSPKLIVTLGLQALNALKLIEHHELTLADHVRTSHRWFGRLLVPAYHPGQRAMIHRSFANQLSVYRFIAETFQRIGQSKRPRSSAAMSASMSTIADGILHRLPTVSYFALHKIAYLIEIEALKTHGRRATNAYFVRQKDGPYCTDLHIKKIQAALVDVRAKSMDGKLYLSKMSAKSSNKNQLVLFEGDNGNTSSLDDIIDDVCARYGKMSDDRLKTSVYLTAPMKNLLRLEQQGATSTYNAPIPFDLAIKSIAATN